MALAGGHHIEAAPEGYKCVAAEWPKRPGSSAVPPLPAFWSLPDLQTELPTPPVILVAKICTSFFVLLFYAPRSSHPPNPASAMDAFEGGWASPQPPYRKRARLPPDQCQVPGCEGALQLAYHKVRGWARRGGGPGCRVCVFEVLPSTPPAPAAADCVAQTQFPTKNVTWFAGRGASPACRSIT